MIALTIKDLENRLNYYKHKAKSQKTKSLIEDMILGVGPHRLVSEYILEPRTLHRERIAITRALESSFNNDEIEDIYVNYTRLLYSQCILEGQNFVAKYKDASPKVIKEILGKEKKKIRYATADLFYEGAFRYFDTLSYSLIENQIPFVFLVDNWDSVGDLKKMSSLFKRISEENLRFSDFKDDLQIEKDILRDKIDANLKRASLKIINGILCDQVNGEQEQVVFKDN